MGIKFGYLENIPNMTWNMSNLAVYTYILLVDVHSALDQCPTGPPFTDRWCFIVAPVLLDHGTGKGRAELRECSCMAQKMMQHTKTPTPCIHSETVLVVMSLFRSYYVRSSQLQTRYWQQSYCCSSDLFPNSEHLK